MGGKGSGRPSKTDKVLRNSFTLPSIKKDIVSSGGEQIYIPNYSGVQEAALKTSNDLLSDPMTSIGDIIYRNGANETDRLGVGSINQVLTPIESTLVWSSSLQTFTFDAGGLSNTDVNINGSTDWTLRATATDKFIIRDTTAGADRLTINSLGRVSIGTTDESYPLNVSSWVNVGDGFRHLGDSNTYFQFTSDSCQMRVGGVDFFRYVEYASLQDVIRMNDDNNDIDVIINGSGEGNLLRTDAGNLRVGIRQGTPTSTLEINGSLALPIDTVTASSTTLDETHHTVLCDTTSLVSAMTINLPAASGCTGRIYRIKLIVSSQNCIIDGNGSETIDGSTTYTLTSANEVITIQSNGSAWYVIAN